MRATKARPAWLRALGRSDPPQAIEAGGEAWNRLEVYKHDAFAATALYTASDRSGRRVVGKFARRSSAFGVPFGWLGTWFHRREAAAHGRAAGLDFDAIGAAVPALLGPVTVGGRMWPAASARVYVAGRPLGEVDAIGDGFFPALTRLVEALHRQGMAVVDLNKRDNVLVGDDGRPWLMDFQISLVTAEGRWRALDMRRLLLGPAQRADRYHLMKHRLRHRPDQVPEDERDLDRYRPRGVRVWRRLIRPVHVARRRLFVALGFRKGRGEPGTEVSPAARGG